MSWKSVALTEVCDIVSGATPKTGEASFWNGDIPWATPADLSEIRSPYIDDTPRKITESGLRSCSASLLPVNSVLFSSRAPIGHIAINRVPMATNQGFKSLVPDRLKLDPKFLFHWLDANRERLKALGNGATFKEVSKAVMSRVKIPLPPLEEQKRIAAILDKADALRQKRKHAIELLDSLTQSIFVEMFGDPFSSASSAASVTIGDVCKVSSGSTPSRQKDAHYYGNIPWVKTAEVNGHTIMKTEEMVTEEGARTARLRTYPVGTVLVAMYGQGKTRGQVGMLGIPATTNQACAALVCSDIILPQFLFHQLQLGYEKLRAMGQGGNQPNLNGSLVKSFRILVPSRELQEEFALRISKVEATKSPVVIQSDLLNDLFSSLQYRAFAGELG